MTTKFVFTSHLLKRYVVKYLQLINQSSQGIVFFQSHYNFLKTGSYAQEECKLQTSKDW